jgi:hypothetical protein
MPRLQLEWAVSVRNREICSWEALISSSKTTNYRVLKSRSFRLRLSIHRRLRARGKLPQGLTSSWSEIPLVNLPKRLVPPLSTDYKYYFNHFHFLFISRFKGDRREEERVGSQGEERTRSSDREQETDDGKSRNC